MFFYFLTILVQHLTSKVRTEVEKKKDVCAGVLNNLINVMPWFKHASLCCPMIVLGRPAVSLLCLCSHADWRQGNRYPPPSSTPLRWSAGRAHVMTERKNAACARTWAMQAAYLPLLHCLNSYHSWNYVFFYILDNFKVACPFRKTVKLMFKLILNLFSFSVYHFS